ncbi:hypothetical protein MNEG_11474 [Monoraphidium neglectum]|uniref:Uncharacterized protein n=1 Tax=Monoraphidium neglectum TaxID=145388 RepID=A0A0D2J9Q4_9CHLO|nr:hypothetical protein MNEG_11474 [Monoraphidium neglectum]KIY96487.1 hypothetical protein MNEG_11474 [Monoraphidium neglectum]|eukprot:XP_013895507.1 hypothetical protein MNEG_11474 [Monoraphidium neglectum]
MPRGGTPTVDDGAYKRPALLAQVFKLKREEAQADIQLIKKLIRESKAAAAGFESGSKSHGSPH